MPRILRKSEIYIKFEIQTRLQPRHICHMKHLSSLHRPLLASLTVGILCIACSKEFTEEPAIESPQPFSVAEAIYDFETYASHAPHTRASVPKAGFNFGNINVDWEDAETSIGTEQYYIEVPIHTDYEYLVRINDVTVRTYTCLVSIKDKEKGSVFTYIKIFIPNIDYARTHVMSDMQKITNIGRQHDFSGSIVYTDITGLPLYVTLLENGYKIQETTIFQETHTLWENCKAISVALDDYTFFRQPNVLTRSDDDDTIDGGGIEVIIITPNGNGPNLPEEPDNESDLYGSFNSWGYGEGAGSGGGGGGLGGYNGPSRDVPNGGGGFPNPDILVTIHLNRKWKNINIYSNDDDMASKLEAIVTDLYNNVEAFKNIVDYMDNKGITVKLIYNEYATHPGVFQKNEQRIVCNNSFDEGVLLEEFFHYYQFKNDWLDTMADREFEAKYLLAYLMDLGQIETVMIYNDNDYNDKFWGNYYNYFLEPSDDNFSVIAEALQMLYFLQWEKLPAEQTVITPAGRSTPNFNTLTASEQ